MVENGFGIAYDCLLFGITYFNDEFLNNDCIPDENGVLIDPLAIYKEALEYNVLPDEKLKVFFQRDIGHSLIGGYFDRRMSWHNDDIDSFIGYINDKENFLKYTIGFYLQTEDSKIISDVYLNGKEVLEKYETDKFIIRDLMNTVKHFESLVLLFTDYANKIREVITALNEKYKQSINLHSDYIKETIDNKFINKILNIEFSKYDDIIIYICLFNKYVLDIFNGKKIIVITGFESIHYQYILKRYKEVNSKNFIKLIADDIGSEIYKTFQNACGSLSVSDIIKSTGFSKYAVKTMLERFLTESIVIADKSINKVMYYKLNAEYLSYAQPKIFEYLEGYFENILFKE